MDDTHPNESKKETSCEEEQRRAEFTASLNKCPGCDKCLIYRTRPDGTVDVVGQHPWFNHEESDGTWHRGIGHKVPKIEETTLGLTEPTGRTWKVSVPNNATVGDVLKILSNKMNEQLPRFCIEAQHLRLQILTTDNTLHQLMDPMKKISDYGANESSKITVHIHKRR